MRLSNFRFEQAAAIFRKDFLLGLRRRAAFAAMLMFSLTAIASLSLSTGGAIIQSELNLTPTLEKWLAKIACVATNQLCPTSTQRRAVLKTIA